MKWILFLILSCSISTFAAKPLKFALNWKAEPQFGGFYAAEDEFKKSKLDIEIIQGGSGTPTIQMLAHGQVDYAIVGGEEIVISNERNPNSQVRAIFAVYQKSPHMIMAHAERNFQTLQDLFQSPGVLAIQSGLPYYQYLVKKWGVPKVKTVPYAGGIGIFVKDPLYSQQGFITSEPLLAEKAKMKVKIFPIADEGFNPYTTVLAVSESRLKNHPEEVKKILLAVTTGWQNYLKNPTPINQRMAQLNPSMDAETFRSSAKAQESLIKPPKGLVGRMTAERWKTLAEQLKDLSLIQKVPDSGALYKDLD